MSDLRVMSFSFFNVQRNLLILNARLLETLVAGGRLHRQYAPIPVLLPVAEIRPLTILAPYPNTLLNVARSDQDVLRRYPLKVRRSP